MESLGDKLIQEEINNSEVPSTSDKETLVAIIDEAVEVARMESATDLSQNTGSPVSSLSARPSFHFAQPEIAMSGNDLIAEQIIESVAVANVTRRVLRRSLTGSD